MADYKEIKGKTIQTTSSDVSDDAAGQVWYNSTSGTFKSVVAGAAWSSSAPLINAYRAREGGFGSATAAVVSGGYPPNVAVTEEYNGSGWSAGGNMNTARQGGRGSGTQTAGVYAAGRVFPTPSNATEEYDGTSWTSVNPTNTARLVPGVTGSGPQTATAIFGGEVNPSTVTNETENYDGTSWTVSGNLPSPAYVADGLGTQTAGLAMGNVAAEYDGSIWTAANNLTTSRSGGGAAGIQTSGLYFGGNIPGFTTATENYDGTSWSNSPATLGTARNALSGMGTSSAALAAAGDQPGGNNLTEEYNFSASVITAAAWASGGNLVTGVNSGGGAGTQTAALSFGGSTGSPSGGSKTDATNEYDGSTWTSGGNLAGGASYATTGSGTQTAGLHFNGSDPGSIFSDTTEEYNGSAWTSVNPMNTGRQYATGFGIQTASIGAGGYEPPSNPSNKSEEYDGTSWATGPLLNVSAFSRCGVGTVSAGFVVGQRPPNSGSAATEDWNGTAWTAGNNLFYTVRSAAGSGIQTNAIIAGGLNPGAIANTARYDGTNWSTAPSLGEARATSAAGGQAPSTASIVFGGGASPPFNSTEEFTGETSALNVKTLTTS